MNTPNEHGAYRPETTEDVARQGHAFAAVHLCQCEDGLYRFALSLTWSLGGFGGPVTDASTGYATAALARQEAIAALLGRVPKSWASEPQSAHDELASLRRQLEQQLRQPSLF